MRDEAEPGATRSVAIDAGLLDEAAELAVDASRVAESALRGAISAEKARRWREENAAAIAAYNDRIERDGLWCDDHRPF